MARDFAPEAQQDATVPLSRLQDGQLTLPRYDVFEDPTARLDINAVISRHSDDFKPVMQTPFAAGFSDSSFWLRFSVYNDSDTDIDTMLVAENPPLDQAMLYEVRDGKPLISHVAGGRTEPLDPAAASHHQPVFRISLPANTSSTLYLRVQSVSAILMPLHLQTVETFYQHYMQQTNWAIMYLSVVLALVAYNFFLFLSLRHVSYLYYCLSSLCLCACMLTMEGWHIPLLGDWFWLKQKLFGILLYGTLVFNLLFAESFLQVRRYAPRLLSILRVLVIANLTLLMLSLALYNSLIILLTEIMGLITLTVIIGTGIMTWHNGNRMARLFLLAWFATFAGAITTVMANHGWLPASEYLIDGLKWGQMIEVILMSFALADRINLITQEREAAQRDAEHARARMQAKSQFLAHVSHEMRTPLNGVTGLAELLEDTPLDAQQRDYVETIGRSAHSLVGIINDILDFTMLESGAAKIREAPVVIAALANDLLAFHASAARTKNLRLDCAISERLPAGIMADPARLRQILVKLLDNAIKFTREGGVALQISRHDRHEGSAVRFTVSDTGPGIPDQFRQRIFQPFEQADNDFNRQHDGTGLGLALCRQIATLMGAELMFTSTPEAGSSFSLTLPLREAAVDEQVSLQNMNSPTQIAATKSLQRTDANILIVEDNGINQMVIKSMLKALGFNHIAIASSGREAVARCRKNPPDIILMDCHMPVMNGFETTREIRALDAAAGRHTAIIAITADVSAGYKARCHEAGMDDYLAKPIEKKRFEEMLDRWLAGDGRA